MISKISEKEVKGMKRFPPEWRSTQWLFESSWDRLDKHISRRWQMKQMGI